MQRSGYRINDPAVIYQLFDDEVVAIYLASGTYHSLPGISGEAFLGFGTDGATAEDVAVQLASRYEAEPARIEQDLLRFAAKLERELLLAPVENCPPAAAPSPASAADANGARAAYVAPDFQTHSDLQDLFLVDPVHDVDAAGWPNLPTPAATAGADASANAVCCRLAGPHIIFETMPDETVAMNLTTGAYYGLTGTAEDVFLLLPHNPTIAEILVAMSAKYSATPQEIEASLREYLDGLAKLGLMVKEPVSDAAGRAPLTVTIARPGSDLPFQPMRLEAFQDTTATPAAPATGAQGTLDQSRFQIRDGDILISESGEEAIVADRETGDYFRLNGPATAVFRLLRERGSMTTQELTSEMVARYDASDRNLTAALLMLLRNLVQVQLLMFAPSTEAGRDSAPAAKPQILLPAEKLPFPGFQCALHKDLRELMSPFNAGRYVRPARNGSRTASERWFVESLRGYFEEAAARDGVAAERALRIGGKTVRLQSTGEAILQDLTKACSHLENGPASDHGGGTDLAIHIWDATVPCSDPFFATTLERILGDWSTQCGPRGQVLGIHGEQLAAILHPGPDVLSVVDLAAGQAFYLKRDKSPLPYWEIGSPFRYVMHSWFAASQGLQFVHGGAVGLADGSGGVLLAAKGGSGKSTTAMVCAAAGMSYAGDDYCLADPATGFLHSLYNTGKLKGAEDLTRVTAVAGTSRNADSFEQGGSGKGIYFMAETWPDRLASGFPLRAILIPRVAAGETASRLEPCSTADAVLAIMPSTVAQLPAAGQDDCDRIAALASKLPAYHLHLGSDVTQIPGLIQQVLRG